MILYCDFCGRRWFTHWPELWPYRYHEEIYCSENCRICSSTLIKLGKGEIKLMARMKKDGSPAKKPGPKAKKPTVTLIEESGAPGFDEEEVQAIRDAMPTVKVDGPLRIETEEPEKVEIVPEASKKVVPLQYDGYTVRCIEGQYGKFYWDYEYNRLDWTSPEGEEVSLSPEGWKTFCTDVIPNVMAILGVPGDV